MSSDKSKPAESKTKPAQTTLSSVKPPAPLPPPLTPAPVLFRKLDWITFAVTTLLVFVGYFLTLAPDVTLEDAGELAVGSYYAGVPHPPGYPVWTLYTWLFTQIPYSNVAWRVALSSAVAAALACGFLALLVSRGSSLMLESITEFKSIERRWESALCVISGFVAGMLLAFNGFMWSQAVIVEVYTLSVLSFMGVLCCLFRWIYAPEQRRYLYWAFFWFGICFTNHQTLVVAAMGIEVAVLMAQPRLGRDLFIGNSLVYLFGLALKVAGVLTSFDNNPLVFFIYNAVGVGSIALVVWLSISCKIPFTQWQAFGRDMLLVAGLGYVLLLIVNDAELVTLDKRKFSFFFIHVFGIASLVVCGMMTKESLSKNNGKNVSATLKALLGLSAVYVVILLLSSTRSTVGTDKSLLQFVAFHLVGLAALAVTLLVLVRRSQLASEIRLIAMGTFVWILGAAFYVYMPLASMTNPPLNWGYPRTLEGFKQAFTRGQYEQTNPTSDFGRYLSQVKDVYVQGAIDEFSLVYLFVGLIPFLFYKRMQKRERAWLIGLTAIWICLAFLLLWLLNPNTEKQSREQARVFFTASHIIVAIAIGYGVTLLGGVLATQYQRFRAIILYSAAGAAAVELYYLFATFEETQLPTLRFAAVMGLGVTLLFTLSVLLARTRALMPVLLALFALMPARSIFAQWSDNEQRGHLFGYWFGHDMFAPPFPGPDGKLTYDRKLREELLAKPEGKLIYPEIPRETILYGGTDPGRFNPTYMIFCESALAPKYKPQDPDFDRRDVALITQNALADKTYLDYIRAHYNRSAQVDPYFFSELVRTEKEREQGRTNLMARALLPIDVFFTDLGLKIETRRRAEGVYPRKEIITASNEDSAKAFKEYIDDGARRWQHDQQFPNEPKQMKPGEGLVVTRDGRVQVSGQIAVMSINAILARIIFDKNPNHEFYIEESFPLDWMYPYLLPYGIIMKINRQPVPEISEEIMARDHAFWSKYSERFIGDWITYDTSIKEICDFVERTYLRHDFTGFKGDPKFVRDDFAQKAFSKLRSAIGWIYGWRVGYDALPEFRPKTETERQRLIKEADFALRQSYAFCPYSPEALHKLVTLLLVSNRVQDARLIAETSLKFDPGNPVFQSYAKQLGAMSGNETKIAQAQTQFSQLEQQFQANPTNFALGLQLVAAYMQMQRTDAAVLILDLITSNPQADVPTLLSAAQSYTQLNQRTQLDSILPRLQNLLGPLQQKYQANTNQIGLAFELIHGYLVTRQTNQALEMADDLVARPQADATILFNAANVYRELQVWPKMEVAMQRLVRVIPTNPEAWYDLAAVQMTVGKIAEAGPSLQKAILLSQERLAKTPGSRDLKADTLRDPRFAPLLELPTIKPLLNAK